MNDILKYLKTISPDFAAFIGVFSVVVAAAFVPQCA